MIKEIGLKNIRVFGDNGNSFKLPKLSIFCGTNSSGKSTILKSLLLLRQTQCINENSETAPGHLKFVGSQVDFGNYYSVVTNHDIEKNISIEITTESQMTWAVYIFLLQSINNENQTMPVSGKENSIEQKYIPYYFKSKFNFLAVQEGSDKTGSTTGLEKDIIKNCECVLASASYEIIVGEQRLLQWSVAVRDPKEEDKQYNISMPMKYFAAVHGSKLMQVENSEKDDFFSTRVFLDGILPYQLYAKSAKNEKWQNFILPPTMARANQDFSEVLRNTSYIGPLRSPSKRYYITNLDTSPVLDPSGEFIPYILKNKNHGPKVWCVFPGSHEKKEIDLNRAINIWLYYFRTGEVPSEDQKCEEIDAKGYQNILVEFEIKTIKGDGSYALVDSGFGYSQVLPVLAICLLSAPQSTVIIEQPELHLNPALQVRLAEFFAAMLFADKQIIIETHSEHIVNTIRVLSAEDETQAIASNSGIFFIDTGDKGPVVHELSIQKNGAVPDWPYNFFGEASSLAGRLLRAQKRFK